MKKVLFLIGLMFCSAAIAGSDKWFSVTSGNSINDFYFSGIESSSGNFFGQFCYFSDTSCMYIFTMKTNCDEGYSYPILVSSEKGATSAIAVCLGKTKDLSASRLSIGKFEDIDSSVRSSSRISLVIAGTEDMFNVHRFSLLGAVAEIDNMRKDFLKKAATLPKPSSEKL